MADATENLNNISSSTLELIDDNKKAKLSFVINNNNFEKAIDHVYMKNRSRINIPGFRKGKASRKIVENYYGKGFFYEEAINYILPKEYEKAISQHKIDIIGYPDFSLDNISDDKNVSMSAVIYLRPKAEINNYKNLSYKPFDTSVSEDDINNKINAEREKNARIMTVDRPVENGDIVNLDCQGYIDGKAFEAGKAVNYDLVIGSHTFIDTFEEQLIGKNITQDLDIEVNVTFPENYHVQDLSNKPAMFKVKINKISKKELPELDDDFAQDVSEFDTFDEYKKDVESKIKQEKEHAAKHYKEDQLTDLLSKEVVINNTEGFKVMVDMTKENMAMNFERNLKAQGLSFDAYLQYSGQTRESILNIYEADADKQTKIRLALEAIAEKENLEVSEEEINSEVNKIAEQTKLDKDKIESLLSDREKENIKKDLLVQKALDLVLDSAVESSELESNSDSELKPELKSESEPETKTNSDENNNNNADDKQE